ncbi:hypothetical protein [Fodinicola acaciae]|uniref:hypothetical protein n=1 Tax=Fodinicola acaciae TaxID=2681555 RepID=UPI0013CFB91F|nr:hypothetical protein [Fodinicola acaciae]
MPDPSWRDLERELDEEENRAAQEAIKEQQKVKDWEQSVRDLTPALHAINRKIHKFVNHVNRQKAWPYTVINIITGKVTHGKRGPFKKRYDYDTLELRFPLNGPHAMLVEQNTAWSIYRICESQTEYTANRLQVVIPEDKLNLAAWQFGSGSTVHRLRPPDEAFMKQLTVALMRAMVRYCRDNGLPPLG